MHATQRGSSAAQRSAVVDVVTNDCLVFVFEIPVQSDESPLSFGFD
jgi:hypothetical protein